MGFDTSFHPVPVDLIQQRVVPYILGQGDLDDLLTQAVRISKVRALANEWGLAVGRVNPPPRRFDPFLHVWGRPFFITIDDPDDVASILDQYTQATPEQVDALAAEQLRALEPNLMERSAQRRNRPELPGDDDLRAGLLWRLDILRAAFAAIRQGKRTIEANGGAHDPRTLLRREVPFAVMHFAASLSPGWMSRGTTWPTAQLGAVPLPTRPFFSPPEPLLGALPREVPEQGWFLFPSITENYMVGGYTAPMYVAPLRRYLADHAATLQATQDGEPGAVARELRKIDEALAYAQRKGWAFCEATDIYCAMQGVMN